MKISITRNQPLHRMGCSSIPFTVSMDPSCYKRLPSEMQVGFLQSPSEDGRRAVRVFLPEEVSDINLEDPNEALSRMAEVAKREGLNTQTFILANILQAIA